MAHNSVMEWPHSTVGKPDMCYDSIALLFNESEPDVFGDHMAFAISCSKVEANPAYYMSAIHKVEVTASPDFASSKMKVTHEVLPGQENCTQIIHVNDKLRVAAFETGALIQIMNFGLRKTFNCDVRGRHTHHKAAVTALAVNSDGTQLSSGSSDGEVCLYDVEGEDMRFMSRLACSNTAITGLAFLDASKGVSIRPPDDNVLTGEKLLAFCTYGGKLGLIDARTKFCVDFNGYRFSTGQQGYSCMSIVRNSASNLVYLGTDDGLLISIDMRNDKEFRSIHNFRDEGAIKRIKEVVVHDENFEDKSFIVFTNGTNQINIVDSITSLPDNRWKVDREPQSVIQDFCQVDDRLITCGYNTSIGCWNWDYARNEDLET